MTESPWPTWLKPAILVLATCLAYLPVLWAGFIWDDNPLLVNNQLVQQPDGLYRIWFTAEPIDYWPVTNSTFWLEWRLWGLHPLGYHVTNLLLHIGASLLVWRVLKSLAVPGAFLGALLFAVHPVNVEAVAWISQRKTILATVFFLLSVLWYVKSDAAAASQDGRDASSARWYWLSLAAFALGMLSKGSIAMLPIVLLLVAWWSFDPQAHDERRGSITTRGLIRTAPFFLVAIPLVWVNIAFQAHNSTGMLRDATLAERVAGAGAVIWFYLSKATLPIDLSFIYPQWQIDVRDPRWWLPLAAAVAVTVALWWQRNSRWGRPLFFAWTFYCLSLVPVLGLTNITFMYYTLVADHYQYLAMIAVVALAAAGCCYWRQQVPTSTRPLTVAVPAVVVLTFMALTAKQAAIYGDEATIWQATVERNPGSWIANYSLGKALIDASRWSEAVEPFKRALQMRPTDPEAQSGLASALLSTGRPQEAIEHAQAALAMKPDYPDAHYNLGSALLILGKPQEAMQALDEALRLRPDYVEAYANLAAALGGLNRPSEAIAAAEQAIALARAQGKAQAAAQVEGWLTRYRAGQR